jgi:ipoprotein LpqH
VKRGCVVAIGSAAIVGVALVGCSSGSGNGSGAPASSASGASAPTAGVKVVVDGKARPVQNKVECVTAANMVMANIGSEQDGIAVTLSAGDNPAMQDLTLGMVDGLPLTYDESNAGPNRQSPRPDSPTKLSVLQVARALPAQEQCPSPSTWNSPAHQGDDSSCARHTVPFARPRCGYAVRYEQARATGATTAQGCRHDLCI